MVAAKRYYFGVGGGTTLFKDLVTNCRLLVIDRVEVIEDGSSNIREIVIVKKFVTSWWDESLFDTCLKLVNLYILSFIYFFEIFFINHSLFLIILLHTRLTYLVINFHSIPNLYGCFISYCTSWHLLIIINLYMCNISFNDVNNIVYYLLFTNLFISSLLLQYVINMY